MKILIAIFIVTALNIFAGESKQRECFKASSPVKIDGELTEWKNSEEIDLEQDGEFDTARDNKDDISATANIMWDDKNFYFAATVTDDIHLNEAAERDIWKGDCIQLALDPTPDNHNDIFNDYEFGMALTPEGPALWRWTPTSQPVKNVKLSIVRKGNKTIYEMKFPFSEIGFTPAENKKLGFSFVVIENDKDMSGNIGWIEWTSGICGYKDSIFWGRLILKENKNKNLSNGK